MISFGTARTLASRGGWPVTAAGPRTPYLRRGELRTGAERVGAARDGAARDGAERVGARLGLVREGAEREGAERVGVVRLGAVRVGRVREGAERVGEVRVGVAREGDGRDGALVRVGALRTGALGRAVGRNGSDAPPVALGRVGAVCRGETDCVHEGLVRVGADGRAVNASRLGGARKVGVPPGARIVLELVRVGALARVPVGSITVTRWPPEVS